MERVIISGGGTGGHIFPALAIANEIRSRYPAAEILFVGALGRMEMEKVPAAGYKIIGLPVTGFPRKPGLKIFIFGWGLLKSNLMAKKLIQEFQPQIAIGVGGFASGPVLRAAARNGIPTLIQEQNSYAGITNKLLAKRADIICVAYDGMDRFFPGSKIVYTGNPVRKNMLELLDNQQEAFEYFRLKENAKVVLIIGGSLGARSVNEAVMQNIEDIAGSEVEFIWQTGSNYYNDIIVKFNGNIPANLHVYEFISRMDLAYAAATVVISRAGAGTISELCLVAKPAILVPSPNVAEDHQTKNALALEREGAAVLIPDSEIFEKLLPAAVSLVHSPEKCSQLSDKIKLLAKPKATKHIVDEVEKLLKK
jgi:UDP-N-acetylglucosamine--N-acetylmuramyl-(pentapeptide) pyrophosphoryl-undecaprenol N-acetylglucosamine transferase